MTVNTRAFYLLPPQLAQFGGGVGSALWPEAAPGVIWGQGTPDGDRAPFTILNKGSLYLSTDQTDDYAAAYVKVDEGGDDADWATLLFTPQTIANTYTSAELHAWELNHTGTQASGGGQVSLNIKHTTAGTAGAWSSGLFVNITQGTTKNVNGYLCAAEFEVTQSNTNVSDWFVLVLNAVSTTMGSHSSYIALRDYGALDLNSFLWFPDHTVATNDATVLVSTGADATATTYMRVIGPSGTPYWIMMTTTAPTGA